VLASREAFFLRSGNDAPVDDEGGGSVVIVCRQSENSLQSRS
jgi:hypothetical protein